MPAERRARKLVGEEWVEFPFEGLRAGDRFQLFESFDGRFICEAEALGDSFLSADGLWTIHCREHRIHPDNEAPRSYPLPVENWRHG